jgi:hypothetical protein
LPQKSEKVKKVKSKKAAQQKPANFFHLSALSLFHIKKPCLAKHGSIHFNMEIVNTIRTFQIKPICLPLRLTTF